MSENVKYQNESRYTPLRIMQFLRSQNTAQRDSLPSLYLLTSVLLMQEIYGEKVQYLRLKSLTSARISRETFGKLL